MPQSSLGALLGSPTAKLLIEDLAPLAQPVGTQPFALLKKDLSVKQGALKVFDQDLLLDASARGSLQIHAADHEASAFGSGEGGFKAPAGRSFAELRLEGEVHLSGQFAPQNLAAYNFSLGLRTGAELDYRHLLPVPATQMRRNALKSVVGRSALPQRIDFRNLQEGELHELTVLAYFKLGLKVSVGGDVSFIGDLFQGFPSQVQFHIQYAAEASLGLSLYERMKVTAGKALLIDPKWVRFRVERERQRQLTIGASFSLQVQYNLTAGLESLLDQALGLLPLPRALETLEKVRTIADEVADSDWEKIKARLREDAADEVTEFLGDAKWLEWAANSKEVKEFLDFTRKAVAAYDALDDRIQSLWGRLLGRTNLQPGSDARKLLDRLMALDPKKPQSLLDQEQRDLIEAVEILSGRSLEEILLASGASDALSDVQDVARKALAFLDSGPQKLIERIEDFADRTGIKKAVEWLRKNATSLDQLKGTTEAQVQQLVRRLTGKALDQISAQDFNQIRQWAQKIGAVLAQPAAIEKELRERIQKLKGEVGFSVAVELDRLSRTTAVLDLEFDPKNDKVRGLVERAGQIDLEGLLRKLPAGDDDPDEAETFPYQLRECVFTSRRVRTSALNLFFSFFGWNKSRRQQVEEVTIQVTREKNSFTRNAMYGGAAILTSEAKGVTATGAAWLVSKGRGTGKDLAASYDVEVGHEIRLIFSREDEKSIPEELNALRLLLNNLGFEIPEDPQNQILGVEIGQLVGTRFSIDLRLPERAVTSFLKDLRQKAEELPWTLDVLNALHRWFDERLISEPFQKHRKGDVLASALAVKEIREAWIKSRLALEQKASEKPFPLKLGGAMVPARLAVEEANSFVNWRGLFVLPISRSRFGNALSPFRETEKQLGTAIQSRRPDALADLSRNAGQALLAIQPSPSQWANPMLGTWLVISRLSRRDPEALRQARGLATLRWQDASGNWSARNLRTWSLPEGAGLMVHDRNDPTGLFPIVK